MIDTNVTALVSITRKLLPALIARKGAIINLASVAGSYPSPGGNVYAGTKAFVHQFRLAIRSDLAGTGVRVTSIEPGMVERSEERRVGNECVSTCRSRWSPSHLNKKKNEQNDQNTTT